LDSDGDGLADCIDVETCDGIDNDGDSLIDEDFPDNNGNSIADCLESELCNGVDDNGNTLIDE
jgi:large repetitive protein